jgi:DNA-binding NarL/FixJ family response regulator
MALDTIDTEVLLRSRNAEISRCFPMADIMASDSMESLPVIAISVINTMVLQGLKRYLKASPFQTVSILASPSELTSEIIRLQPSAIIIEISTQSMEGFEVITTIKNLQPAIKILVLGDYSMLSLVKMIFQSGAHGYLLSMPTQSVMVSALESIIRGEYILDKRLAYFRPALANALTAHFVAL